jgi:hypothetical protein
MIIYDDFNTRILVVKVFEPCLVPHQGLSSRSHMGLSDILRRFLNNANMLCVLG